MVSDAVRNIGKKVQLELVGLDGNAFSLMGAFKEAARKQGWTKEEIAIVLDECKNGDYNHLLVTLMEVCESPSDEEEEEEEEEDYEEDYDEDEEDEEESEG